MESILVTGGAGFIGSCLVRRLLATAPYIVVNLDKLTYAGHLASLRSVSKHPQHVFVQGDIGDQNDVFQLLIRFRPLSVIHCAAESHVDRSIDGPLGFVQTNLVGTARLLDAVRLYWSSLPNDDKQRFRFVYISTDEVYGTAPPEKSFSESAPYAPRSPYAASKAGAGHLVTAYHHTYGIPVITTLSTNNYGPYQFPEKLIPLMILNALEGQQLPLYGDGQQVRDWIHVEDHADAILHILKNGSIGEAYNIAGGQQFTNLRIVELLCAIVDRLVPHLDRSPCQSLIRFVEDRPGHDRRYAIDASKLAAGLDWRPRWKLESGLEATVQWYLENRDWVAEVNGSYNRERIGLSVSRGKELSAAY